MNSENKKNDAAAVVKSGPMIASKQGPGFSYASEFALLTSCMLAPGEVLSACRARGVEAKWFYSAQGQTVWETMVEMDTVGMEIDEVTLIRFLVKKNNDASGSALLVNQMCSTIETHAFWESYFKIVETMYLHRYAKRQAQKLLEGLQAPINTFPELAEILQGPVTELSGISISEEARRLYDVADEFLTTTRRLIAGQKEEIDTKRMIYWGIKGADERLYPFNPNRRDNLIIIAGRPGHGKTALASQIVYTNLRQGKICVCFCLETEIEDMLSQMAAQHAGINLLRAQEEGWRAIIDEPGGGPKVKLYDETLEWLRDCCEKTLWIFADDYELYAIEARWKEVMSKTGRIDLGVIDHCHLVECTSKPPMTRLEQLEKISRRSKILPKSGRCVMLLLCQMNRAGASDPTLEALRGSGSLEQDADRVIFVTRPHNDSNGNEQKNRAIYEQRLVQAKMKNGPKLYIKVGFEAICTRFKDMDGFVQGDKKRGRNKKDEPVNYGTQY